MTLSFQFFYCNRKFEFYTKTREQTSIWVTCLELLKELKSAELETATSSRSMSYFNNLANTMNILDMQGEVNHDDAGSSSSDSSFKSEKKSQSSRVQKQSSEKQKFENMDAKAYECVLKEHPGLLQDYQVEKLSKAALVSKGLENYLKAIPEKHRNSRVIYGFLFKRSKGKFKFFNRRWWFMISSRPLNSDAFLDDPLVLQDGVLPPMIEFDVLYYYAMDKENDGSRPLGEVPTLDILNIVVKDMTGSKEGGHAFILDVGQKIFHLNTPHRFELEKWVQALEISI